MIASSLALGTVFFVVFGWLSDKIGRKPIIMAGLIAALTYFPLFKVLTGPPTRRCQRRRRRVGHRDADPATASSSSTRSARRSSPTPATSPRRCGAQLRSTATTSTRRAGSIAKVRIGDKEFVANDANFARDVGAAITAAGYPGARQIPTSSKIAVDRRPGSPTSPGCSTSSARRTSTLIAILTILVIYVTMVYGPIAAALVEFFPTRIRYTGLSLPYHIGNGWFGGLLPATSFAMVAQTGDIYFGLWYPIVVALMTFVIGASSCPRPTSATSSSSSPIS